MNPRVDRVLGGVGWLVTPVISFGISDKLIYFKSILSDEVVHLNIRKIKSRHCLVNEVVRVKICNSIWR